MTAPRDWPPRRIGAAVMTALLVGLLFAHGAYYSFLCDDAYITFRFVRNLLDGHGLVYNPGEYVEGYSNFLWALQLAALWAMAGIGPEWASWSLGWASTAVAVAAVLRLAWTTPFQSRESAVVLTALLLATNRSFAVWCTSGLETRQFTAFLLLGVLLLHQARWETRRLLLAGSVFGLAILSRPEGMLFGACGGVWLILEGARTRRSVREVVTAIATLAAPQVVVATAHLAFRLSYYGYPLPNTFYAKGEYWPLAGVAYLAGAAVEHGLVVLGPLALLGAWARYRRGDSLHVLGALLVLPHQWFLARVGGDHFEYRMLDYAFPLLFLAAADGILFLASFARGRFRVVAAPLITALVLPYVLAIPWMDHVATRSIRSRGETYALHVDLTEQHGGALWHVPGVAPLAHAYNRIRTWERSRLIATRWLEHATFWRWRLTQWSGYDGVPLPAGLAYVDGAMGIKPWFLPDVAAIDAFGLTDAVVARMPTRPPPPGTVRRLAHPRRLLGTYMRERTNLEIRPHHTDPIAALKDGDFAVRLGPRSWMPIRCTTIPEPLAGREIVGRRPTQGTRNQPLLLHRGRTYRASRVLWNLEKGFAGWTVEGDAFDEPARGKRPPQTAVKGFLGKRFASSFTADRGDRAQGSLRSPPFEVGPSQHLGFLVGGGDRDVGVTVWGPDGPIATRHGERSEKLRHVIVRLDGHEGEPLTIEVFDRASHGWGHVLADHFSVVDDVEMPDWLAAELVDGPAPE